MNQLCVHTSPPYTPLLASTEHWAGLPALQSGFPPAAYFTHDHVHVSALPVNLRPHPILSREFLSSRSQMVSRSSRLPFILPHYQENAGVLSKAWELGCQYAMRRGQCRKEAFSSHAPYISSSPTKLWGSVTLGSIWWTAFPLESDRTFLFAVCIKASKSVVYFISSPPHLWDKA